jgi:hypothetical protein
MAALIGALLLTLVLASPAAASQKVEPEIPGLTGPFDFWEAVDIDDPATDWPFECVDGTIYYGSYGSAKLTLWYPNDVEAADMFPDPGAWPWVKGLYQRQGVDYFSAGPDGQGLVVSGKFHLNNHLSDHHVGSDAPGDYESWTETMTGKNWGIQLPGYGSLFHESGNYQYRLTVVDQVSDPEVILFDEVYPWRGNQTFDTEALCALFGFDVEYAP